MTRERKPLKGLPRLSSRFITSSLRCGAGSSFGVRGTGSSTGRSGILSTLSSSLGAIVASSKTSEKASGFLAGGVLGVVAGGGSGVLLHLLLLDLLLS